MSRFQLAVLVTVGRTCGSAVDLEIDVVGHERGFLVVVDEDEFEGARLAVSYPDDVVAAALAARDQVMQGMIGFEEPFGMVGWNRLREAVRRR